MSAQNNALVVCVLIACVLSSGCLSLTCPCEDYNLCKPIQTRPQKEIFIFSLTNSSDVWLKYDWNLVTTLVTVGFHNDQLMCLAHKHGARIVNIANFNSVKGLANNTLRQIWIEKQVQLVQQYYLDGVNFDFEDEIPEDHKEYSDGYTALVRDTKSALMRFNPYTQVTVDVAWSPQHIDSRFYDYTTLARVSDFLFVMSYDERSQIFGACVAAANSAIGTTFDGIKLYLQLREVDPSKLVLGLPWYGYDYPCLQLFPNNTCVIPFHPWRGVQCSDAAGRQHNYKDVVNMLKNSTSGRLWDKDSQSPYFNYKNAVDGKLHQVWYDDPESLGIKYKFVHGLGLRGAGMWQADTLDNSNTPEAKKQREEMWHSLYQAIL